MIRIFRLLPKDDAADIFAYMSSDREHALIDSLTNKELENIINDLYSDDVMELLEELPANVVKRIIAAVSYTHLLRMVFIQQLSQMLFVMLLLIAVLFSSSANERTT